MNQPNSDHNYAKFTKQSPTLSMTNTKKHVHLQM